MAGCNETGLCVAVDLFDCHSRQVTAWSSSISLVCVYMYIMCTVCMVAFVYSFSISRFQELVFIILYNCDSLISISHHRYHIFIIFLSLQVVKSGITYAINIFTVSLSI